MGPLTELVKRHYANVSEDHIEGDRAVMSDDIVHVSAAAGTVRGIDAFLAFVAGFKQAFPDLRYELRAFVEGPDTVVTKGIVVGTNTGPMAGPAGIVPAKLSTGKPLQIFLDQWPARQVSCPPRVGASSSPSATSGKCAMDESSRIASTMTRSRSWDSLG